MSYWSFVFKVTSPENNPAELVKLHKSTRVAVADPAGNTIYTRKYTKAHRGIIESDSAKCIACHGTMITPGVTAENAEHPIHQKMLTASMLNFSCTDCHKEVDIRKRSPSHITIRVDRTLCPKCHNPSVASRSAEDTFDDVDGIKFGPIDAPEMSEIMTRHGSADDKKKAGDWIKKHPRVAMAVGVKECRRCHQPGSELDFCRVCHLRGGFRPSHHRATYKVRINEIYPTKAPDRNEVIETTWKGYHFVVAREALAKMGTKVDSPRDLPLDKVAKLPCGACHIIEDWCTRCHIKHNPKWLDPNVGHPAFVKKYGRQYCSRCHDITGAKCVACHTFAGQLR